MIQTMILPRTLFMSSLVLMHVDIFLRYGNLPFKIPMVFSFRYLHLATKVLNSECSAGRSTPGFLLKDGTKISEGVKAESAKRYSNLEKNSVVHARSCGSSTCGCHGNYPSIPKIQHVFSCCGHKKSNL